MAIKNHPIRPLQLRTNWALPLVAKFLEGKQDLLDSVGWQRIPNSNIMLKKNAE